MEVHKSVFLLLLALASVFSTVSAFSATTLFASAPAPTPIPSYLTVSPKLDLSGLPTNVATFLDLPSLSKDHLAAVDPVVKDVCGGTDYPNECVLAVVPELRRRQSNPSPAAPLQPVCVLKMELSALAERTNKTLHKAKVISKDPATPRPVVKILDTCVENYKSLLDDLKDAAVAVEINDFGRMESVLSASIEDVATCSSAFDEEPEADDPMASVDEFLRKLCSNVLAITQNIKATVV